MAVGVDVHHQEVAVFAGADLHLGAVTRKESAIVVDPDLDRRIVAAGAPDRRAARGPKGKKGKEQGRDHGTLRTTAVPTWKLRRGKALSDGRLSRFLTASPVPPCSCMIPQHLGLPAGSRSSSLEHFL